MRPYEVFLYILFPILIAVGIALGMDATSHTEFKLARAALSLAALVAFGVLMNWFYQADFSTRTTGIVITNFVILGGALVAGIKWFDLKENIFCVVQPVPHLNPAGGPYELRALVHGPYPMTNVQISIRSFLGPTTFNFVKIGDLEPDIANELPQFPSLTPGKYQIDVRARSGNFQEILELNWNGTVGEAHVTIDRISSSSTSIIYERLFEVTSTL